jgi:hypothetical protein
MFRLLSQRDRGLLIPNTDLEIGATGTDREVAIAQAPDQIERQLGRLLTRHAQRIGRYRRLHRRPHRRRGAEVPVRRGQSLECLVWPLEVVMLDVERHAPLTVLEVREHGPRQQLFPQRLPEALDLAAGLRVMRPALDVPDAVALELGLELGGATPAGVLPALVGQDLARHAILGNTTRQRLQHQRAALMMRERQTHQIARVIIQERRHVQPLVLPEQERKQVRLP